MTMDHLKIMALKVPRTVFCVSTSFSRTSPTVVQMLKTVLLRTDHCSEGNGSIVIVWWKGKVQPRFRKHPEILKTNLPMIFFVGTMSTANAVNDSQFSMLNIAAILN